MDIALKPVRGILFDKDGVLFDFQGTWGTWALDMIAHFARGDAMVEARMAEALDIDLVTRLVRPSSFMIAGTAQELVDVFVATLPDWDKDHVTEHLFKTAGAVNLVPTVDLEGAFSALKSQGLKIGIATNDLESVARAHLKASGIEGMFDFVAGSDSGYGAKPEPGMCDAFADTVGLPSDALVMVGDSTHDMHAGRAAGFTCVGVLTGVAGREVLAAYADAVLPDIGGLVGWLAETGRG